MARIASNKILLGAMLLLALYWIAIPQLDGYSNAITSSLFIVGGILVLGSWGWDALQAAWSGITKGPQFALIGVALVAFGAVYHGTFSFTWWWVGEPKHWLNTSTSGFGKAVMAVGFVIQYLADNFQITRFKPPKVWFVVVAMALSVGVGVIIGYTFGETTASLGGANIHRPV